MRDVKRLYSLDAARGIAALAIVVWHWQHMYLVGGGKLEDRSIQPFYALLYPLYTSGWLAVEFFFTLSGFVFFWLYGQAIADKSLGLGKFWLARFSRLYPLHFITLIVIAVMQLSLLANGHPSFVYGGTNLPNFVLNLLFLQYFIPGWTYNGPEWSVGVEIILYAFFFVYCRLFKPHWLLPLVVAVGLGIWVMYSEWALGRGIIGFFLGGLVYEAWRRLRDRQAMVPWITPLFVLTAALWIYAMVEAHYHPLTGLLDAMGLRGWWWLEMSFRLGLVPLTVLALALQETKDGRFWPKIAPLGDLTYALYLLHFPLQLALALAVTFAGLPLAPLQSPWGMIGYFVALIALSIASFNWIERPAQRWIRTRFGG